jgi:sugar O-acyltransferase (sialic acid O-acetyltransferase NeuD family)
MDKFSATIVFGSGGHGKVIADILISSGHNVVGFIDDNPKEKEIFGRPVWKYEKLSEIASQGIVAIGDNFTRSKVVEKLKKDHPHFEFITAIHPSAKIGQDVLIQEGTAVMAGVVINTGTRIGSHTILNTGARIDHDCRLADFTSIAPGSILGGEVQIGAFSALGLGSMVIHGIKIEEHVVIGAGSVVVKNISGYCVAFGNPCKKIRSREEAEKYL